MGQIIFADPRKRKQLNGITHWRIFRNIIYEVIDLKIRKGHAKVILDAPLLFETGILEHMCYPIICVYLDDPEVQLARLMKRNPQLSEDEAFQRMQSQFPTEKKLKKSEIKIHNDEKPEDLERIVKQKYVTIIKKYASK